MSDLISFKTNWKNGVVQLSHIKRIWKDINSQKHLQILLMLENFEIVSLYPANCTKIEKLQKLVIPSLVIICAFHLKFYFLF